MMKEFFLVGGSSAVGGYLLSKWGGKIEAKMTEWKIPPTVGHVALVMASATGVYWGLRKVL